MTFPSSPVSVPDVVAKVAAHRPASAVWVNELGGVTFAIDSGAEFVKTYPETSPGSLRSCPPNEYAGLLLAEADRWADLAIASVSLDWNFPTEGPGGFEATLLEAYGVMPDHERMAYCRRAWD